jgi:hypothetical protein
MWNREQKNALKEELKVWQTRKVEVSIATFII